MHEELCFENLSAVFGWRYHWGFSGLEVECSAECYHLLFGLAVVEKMMLS